MKKLVFILTSILLISSCENNLSYYEQINKQKTISKRFEDLNKNMQEIRKSEKGKLILEDVDYMEFEYQIGDLDSYIVSYLFDDKGVYEIGFDGYFASSENAKIVMDEFTQEISKTNWGKPEETPRLKRWLNPDKSATVEIDYTDVEKGMAVVTIFANE